MQEHEQTANQSVPQMPERVTIERVANYDVYDAEDEHIGHTTALWMDEQNKPAFIGVKTAWLLGKTHVIPAWGAEVNHQTERIRLPCQGDLVKDAPSFSPDEELDYAKEREIIDYYRSKGGYQSYQGYPQYESEAQAVMPEETTQRVTERERLASERPAEQPRSSREETVIPLHEEELKVGKRTVETGGIRLRKIIRTETIQQPVELQREEIQVERVPATEAQMGEKAFEQQDIYIPLRREEAVVEKQAHVREAVRVKKSAEAEQQTVSGEVRKEEVEVDKQTEQQRRRAA